MRIERKEGDFWGLGYRESAFLAALSSAGAAWGVATACTQGWLENCQCDIHQHATRQSWEWGGCSYGIKFGLVTSRQLLTKKRSKVKQRSTLRHMEKHNLKAGRLVRSHSLLFFNCFNRSHTTYMYMIQYVLEDLVPSKKL